MAIDEYDIYDEENPAPRLRVSSNSEENPISSVISATGSTTASALHRLSSEENIDDENTDSVQPEKDVSNEIVTQQETDTDSLFVSEEIFNTDTNESIDSLKSAEETSVEKIVTEEEDQTQITKKKEKKYPIKK
jgi:hypothetical protein